jgi:hypothetical protein
MKERLGNICSPLIFISPTTGVPRNFNQQTQRERKKLGNHSTIISFQWNKTNFSATSDINKKHKEALSKSLLKIHT